MLHDAPPPSHLQEEGRVLRDIPKNGLERRLAYRPVPIFTIFQFQFIISLILFISIFVSSPLQDDFIILHIPGEYDSVLETVFKTEFLTLLSSKYQDSVNRQLKVDIASRYDKHSV